MDLEKLKRTQKPKSEGGNLTPWKDPEIAKEMSKRGLEARMRNKALREEAKHLAHVLRKDDLEIDPIAAMNQLLAKAIIDGNDERALQIATALAPYKAAKLSSTELKVETVDAKEMSQEDLDKRIAELEKELGGGDE